MPIAVNRRRLDVFCDELDLPVIAIEANAQALPLPDDAYDEDLGCTPAQSVMHRFNLDHLDLVREVFPNVERFVREDVFLFPTADAALRYYASGAIDAIQDRPPDGSHRASLLALVGVRILEIIRSGGRLPRPQRHRVFRCDGRLIRRVFVDEVSDVAHELMHVDRVPGGVHMNDRTLELQRIPSLVDDERNQLVQRGSIGVAGMTFTGACASAEAFGI